ncbi:CoA-transferase subunit beta [Vibrio natriegens]|uniref:3-oxoadipate--succinyl-CoA transferase subunit B n=1 Tax=Vibrio natriegens NBRC 15636 = ATCC 14048 = DSM 759 TaxID=1219067 RepID=A0AAN1CYT8_VIBNA|nr:CoA-transferase subunit beta [Vibrio natriegens]ALR17917.1 3-oxoadipate:succinyl-CoA transferase [Vibrio natriegens NBRC 15636 = ATCC 14048 = DSM 759]ANQ15410.1 3-oxoadipate--succinyl-CoA transferase subunit B [Vibrio natriegens NBRC 15636 = ATCC 14048 = DSM 759]EPM41119.1 3-oxoadipate:succinyl-CoA transferase subunit B [Vibrio natriegens NBRC 15636 = ATCC 14048 = DSM 759]MDX6029232.1 CoA-transferase subunit beta [Vibrio natriegens NBRC 15636 = ATCC 14048 = DSM 759]UUI14061.1 CoA-transferas
MSFEYTSSEMMSITAARALTDNMTCFVGIGLPSEAANLARLTHAPNITLIYESGTLQTKPNVLPLSIGDGELCHSALSTVSVPEMFRYWLQGGHVSVGFLGTAQIDRFANLNTTLVGDYREPKVRLPGGGGAPEIATNAKEVFITVKHSKRTFVKDVDFITTVGFGRDGKARDNVPNLGKGPTVVITDLCILRPDPATKELIVVSLHPGVTQEDVIEATGWEIQFSDNLETTPAPNSLELKVLRELKERTQRQHANQE